MPCAVLVNEPISTDLTHPHYLVVYIRLTFHSVQYGWFWNVRVPLEGKNVFSVEVTKMCHMGTPQKWLRIGARVKQNKTHATLFRSKAVQKARHLEARGDTTRCLSRVGRKIQKAAVSMHDARWWIWKGGVPSAPLEVLWQHFCKKPVWQIGLRVKYRQFECEQQLQNEGYQQSTLACVGHWSHQGNAFWDKQSWQAENFRKKYEFWRLIYTQIAPEHDWAVAWQSTLTILCCFIEGSYLWEVGPSTETGFRPITAVAVLFEHAQMGRTLYFCRNAYCLHLWVHWWSRPYPIMISSVTRESCYDYATKTFFLAVGLGLLRCSKKFTNTKGTIYLNT